MKKVNWNLIVFILSFTLSLIFSFLTNKLSNNASNIIMILLILLVISIGIVFDMLGVAVLTAKESTFHAKSSKKIKGAKRATKLIRKNVRVASFCNDIIGDVCGIVSGGLGAVLAISMSKYIDITISSIITSAIISALTVTGKAIFKTVAVKKADNILFIASKLMSIFDK